MPKRRPKKLSAVAERVVKLLELLAGGNQREFARQTGVSQALVSQIVAGSREPGPRLMRAISQLSKVNPDWLQTGQGEPLLASRDEPTEKGWAVSVASCLLPGLPTEHQELLTSRVEYVPGCIFQPGLYFVEASRCLPAQADPKEHMMDSDLVLISANTKSWRTNIQSLAGRLCAIRQQVDDLELLTLQRLVVRLDGSKVVLLAPAGEAGEQAESGYHKPMRAIQLETPKPDNQTRGTKVDPASVVGVAVQLMRNLH